MRSLQLVLHSGWDFVDESVEVEWSPSNQEDLWWSDLSNLMKGVSLMEVHPNVLFWSDTTDQGWGAHLRDQFVSGLWSPAEHSLSINLWELHAIHLGPHHFRHLLRGLCGQRHRSLLRQETEWDILPGSQHRSPAPSLGRGLGDHSGSPAHYGVPECGCQLVESSPSGSGVRMDPLPGCCRLTPDFVAGDGGPLCHGHELSPASLFLTAR